MGGRLIRVCNYQEVILEEKILKYHRGVVNHKVLGGHNLGQSRLTPWGGGGDQAIVDHNLRGFSLRRSHNPDQCTEGIAMKGTDLCGDWSLVGSTGGGMAIEGVNL